MAEIERTKEAAEIWQRALEAKDDKDYTKAIAEYSKLLELLPNDNDTFKISAYEWKKDDICYWRGFCFEQTDQPEKALDDYSKAISINPNEAGHYSTRSGIYLALGETEKAKADLEKAVGMNQKDAAKYYCLFGVALEKYTGDKREAAKYLKKSIELGDFYGSAKNKLDKWGM